MAEVRIEKFIREATVALIKAKLISFGLGTNVDVEFGSEDEDLTRCIIKAISYMFWNKQLLLNAMGMDDLKKQFKKYNLTTSSSTSLALTSVSGKNMKWMVNDKCFNYNVSGQVARSCPRSRREKGCCFKFGRQDGSAPSNKVIQSSTNSSWNQEAQRSSAILLLNQIEKQSDKSTFAIQPNETRIYWNN